MRRARREALGGRDVELAAAGVAAESRTGGMRLRVVASALLLACALTTSCAHDKRPVHGWTVEEAEAVTTVRGMTVHVLGCRGLGRRLRIGDTARYRRFACEAGARRPGEAYDTVAVHYTIRVVDSSEYVLESARFYGGPGIP